MSTYAVKLESMQEVHESARLPVASGWPLAPGEVLRLAIGPGTRWLRVRTGQIWLTQTRQVLQGAPREADLWLSAGDQLVLPPGSEVVVEARAAADFELLVPPQACSVGRFSLPRLAWRRTRGWAGALAARARSAAPQARWAHGAISGGASIA